MAAQIVFRTQGVATSFLSTTNGLSFFRTASQSVSFVNTNNPTSLFLTGNKSVSFVNTSNSVPIFITASQAISFAVTPDTTTTKLLKLKIGELTFDSEQTYVEVPDDTGEYNADTNPGGWNPDGDPPVVGRPARDEALLWTVYRIWSRPAVPDGYGINTQTPDSQAEETDDPYVYTLTFPTETIDQEAVPIRGIYEIIMMAVPLNETYANYVGNVNLATMAKEFPDWYVTSVGVMVDPAVVNCLNKKRYEFLQEVMCGKCNEEYLTFYGIYIGMLNAMEVQEWDRATEFYEKLKEVCACEPSGPGINIGCGC